MSKDELLFVWNCCDELEKATERETVLRIAGELRERFMSKPAHQCSNTEAFLSGENTGCDGVTCPVHTHGRPAPESGVEFERPDLNDSDEFEVKP